MLRFWARAAKNVKNAPFLNSENANIYVSPTLYLIIVFFITNYNELFINIEQKLCQLIVCFKFLSHSDDDELLLLMMMMTTMMMMTIVVIIPGKPLSCSSVFLIITGIALQRRNTVAFHANTTITEWNAVASITHVSYFNISRPRLVG